MIIRHSTQSDLTAVTGIYAHHVETGTASFELTPPDVAEMARRRDAVMAKNLPWLAAVEADGTVLGYAYAGPYRARPAYDWSVEDSIYLAPGAQGRGIGYALLTRLVDECALAGRRQMIAVIGDSANAGSIALHRKCGFRPIGLFQSAGWKFGRWIDSVLMQCALGPGDSIAPGSNDSIAPGSNDSIVPGSSDSIAPAMR